MGGLVGKRRWGGGEGMGDTTLRVMQETAAVNCSYTEYTGKNYVSTYCITTMDTQYASLCEIYFYTLFSKIS